MQLTLPALSTLPARTARTARPARPARKFAGPRDADGMAVASFVLGLVSLLVMNLILGPVAIAFGLLALRRGTARRGRALLGLGLGVAGLVVFGVLVTMNGTVSWV
ncbi:DUF4190 domain-containing protein [Streptomyces monticola]|uniref:DUF4190 domain-containing protein n=1 Tax=Streptomyces monticola TaxID=2666263 RepID=A0ABW2JXX0_9ACTN